jgi:hypothetical protein
MKTEEQSKQYTLLTRLDLDISFASKCIVDEMKTLSIFDKDSNWKVLDRAIAGGQLIGVVEQELLNNQIDPVGRVYGCEKHEIVVQYAINKLKLKGKYVTNPYKSEDGLAVTPRFDDVSFIDSNRNFKYIEIGNYPYNDGSISNTPIWDKFIDQARKDNADAVAVVVQASFLSQDSSKGFAKKVKDNLQKLGCYKIVINDFDDFGEKAKVKTCIIFCRKGYAGSITYVERKTGRSVVKSLDQSFDMNFDPNKIQFLSELKTGGMTKTDSIFSEEKFISFDRFSTYKASSPEIKKKFCIGGYYKANGYEKTPLRPFKILDPSLIKIDEKKKTTNYDWYVIWGYADTLELAEIELEKLKSFWFNPCVTAALMLTRYSVSTDATQYAAIPKTEIDHVFSENELFDRWNISTEMRDFAKSLLLNYVEPENDNEENN